MLTWTCSAVSAASCWVSATVLYHGMDLQYFASSATTTGMFDLLMKYYTGHEQNYVSYRYFLMFTSKYALGTKINFVCSKFLVHRAMSLISHTISNCQCFPQLAGRGCNGSSRGSLHPRISTRTGPPVRHRSRLSCHSTAWAIAAIADSSSSPRLLTIHHSQFRCCWGLQCTDYQKLSRLGFCFLWPSRTSSDAIAAESLKGCTFHSSWV